MIARTDRSTRFQGHHEELRYSMGHGRSPIEKGEPRNSMNQIPLLTLVWLKKPQVGKNAREMVTNMLSQACGPYGDSGVVGGDSQLAWGMLLPEHYGALTSWSIYSNGKEVCLIEGDMYDDLPEVPLPTGNNPALASHVAQHMAKTPNVPLLELNGAYAGVYIDAERSCGYAFGDQLGLRSLYWLSSSTQFVVTGNLWAFRGYDAGPKEWDTMALAEMLTIGYPMAGRTWMKNVSLLQRGRQIRSYADGNTQVEDIRRPIERQSWSLKNSIYNYRESLDETSARLHRRLKHPIGLGLSGGLDSRLLLASLHSQGLAHANFTFCHSEKDLDNKMARVLADHVGQPHTSVVFPSPSPITHRDFRVMNEGESPGGGYYFLARQASASCSALMLGMECSRTNPTGPYPISSYKSKSALVQGMLEAERGLFTPEQLIRILAADFQVPYEEVKEEWNDSFVPIKQQSVLDVFLDHIGDYHVNRRTRPRLEQTRYACTPVYPFLDYKLYTTSRSLPLEHLNAERTHLGVLTGYGIGLERYPHADHLALGLPIHKEYTYRRLVDLGRIVNQKMLEPWGCWAKEQLGCWGLNKMNLQPYWMAELPLLKNYPQFDSAGMTKLIEQTRRGAFLNLNAVRQLFNVQVIQDFLFGKGLSNPGDVVFVQPHREVRFRNYEPRLPSLESQNRNERSCSE